MKGLTKRQREIVNFIESFIEDKQFSPSYREIQNYFGFSSLGTIYKHIQVLKRKGFVSSEEKSSRSITLNKEVARKESGSVVELPFVGIVSAGSPIVTFPKIQMLSIPDFLVHTPEKSYVLQAKGDSLNEEQICDGDLLIVEARQEAHPGEIVVALINAHDTIVKKFYSEGQYVRLEGNTSAHQPIIIKQDSIKIQGVMVGLLRLYN